MATTRGTEAVTTLAAQMYQFARNVAELPFAGSNVEDGERNESWADQTREHLHSFLVLHTADLDAEWTEMIGHTATAEAWEAYGA